MISNEVAFLGKLFFIFQPALTLDTISMNKMTLVLTNKFNVWILTISLMMKRV